MMGEMVHEEKNRPIKIGFFNGSSALSKRIGLPKAIMMGEVVHKKKNRSTKSYYDGRSGA